MEVVDVSEEVGDDAENVEEKPKLSPAERLAAKKRFRTQRRLSTMKNKVLRNAQWATLKKEKRKVSLPFFIFKNDQLHFFFIYQVKKEAQQQRKKEAEALGDKAPPKQVPRTIENTREYDATTVDADDEEVQFDITHDEYESYFSKTYEPKILITSSDNPHTVSAFI